MKNKLFVIPFRGLKEGNHKFEYIINKEFFEFYEYSDVDEANLSVALDFNKKSTLFELSFSVSGDVKVICDVSNEFYQQPLNAELELVVKFGEVYNDEFLDVLVLPNEAYEVDISQYIYEMIVLAIPTKKIHPKVEDGTLKSDILDKLEELQPKENKNNISSDPRWDKLKGLLTDKKE